MENQTPIDDVVDLCGLTNFIRAIAWSMESGPWEQTYYFMCFCFALFWMGAILLMVYRPRVLLWFLNKRAIRLSIDHPWSMGTEIIKSSEESPWNIDIMILWVTSPFEWPW